jgi:hypothetical protein
MDYSNITKLREIIDRAMEDHTITREEYDQIIEQVTKDGVVDAHERALLAELQEMLQDGTLKFRKK